jgi:hypothetical protein
VALWLPGGGWRGWSDEDGAALSGHGLTVVPGRAPLPAAPAWIDRLQRLDPARVVFAHDNAVWEPPGVGQ